MSAPTSWLWTFYDTNGTTVLGTISGSDPLVHKNPSYTFPTASPPGDRSYFVRSQPSNVHGAGDTGPVAVLVTEPAAFDFVRTTEALVSPGNTSAVIQVPIEVGNLVVVSALSIDAPAINVPTDSVGNTYAAVAAVQTLPGSTGKIRTFWGVATSGGSAVVLTVGLGGAMPTGQYGQINVTQYVHQGTVSLYDHKEGSGTAVGQPIDPGPINALVGNLLLYGVNLTSTVVPTDAAGWTSRHTPYHFIADRMNLSAGIYSYQPTYTGVQDWIAQVFAFTTDTVPSASPPTVALALTTGNPALGIPYQVVANTTGTVDRVTFKIDGGADIVRTVAPYLLFAAPQVISAGQHTIVASVYDTPGGTPDDTDTLVVTESSGAGTWLVVRELCERVPDADSYKFYKNGSLNQSPPQPPTGNPQVTFTVTGADADTLLEWSSVKSGVESARFAMRDRFTDPSATAIEGLKEASRTWDGTNWVVAFRWTRKPSPALSYNFYRDGSLIHNVAQPAGTAQPTYTDTFTGASVSKVIGVAAVYAGPVDGPRASAKFTYLATATGAPKGGKEISRTYTP